MSLGLGRVAIVGVGLIGGSFSLALKAAGACERVVGAGRRLATLECAQALGVIDEIAADPAAAARGADLVLIAAPVAQFSRILSAIGPVLGSASVVTDAGSTKADVVAAARSALGARYDRFVPGHPLAGAERSGPESARADLFRGRRVVLTPETGCATDAEACVRAAWEACGALVSRLSVAEHDAALAAVSHLPHLVAYALFHDVALRPDGEKLLGLAAGGLRDSTRLASSHPEMWRDICVANAERLLAESDRFIDKFAELRAMVERRDAAGLERVFTEARDARDAWLRGGGPTDEH